MTLLRVHDHQQDLSEAFVKLVKTSVNNGNFNPQKRERIFQKGQEMGFCNDEIRVLVEDIIPVKFH